MREALRDLRSPAAVEVLAEDVISLAQLRGPLCRNAECPDPDGEHPYHLSAVVRAHEEARTAARTAHEKLRASLERVRATLLREWEGDAQRLSTVLHELDLVAPSANMIRKATTDEAQARAATAGRRVVDT